MRTLKIIALSAIFVFVTASLAMACDGKKAETASAKACCSKSEVTTASTNGAGCALKAAVTKACADGATCAAKAAMKTAGASCSSKADMANAISVETVRMPSGALAVMYNGSCAASTGFLQASADKGCEGFACSLAQGMAADDNVHTEMAKTEHGVMILVTAKDVKVLDKYEAEYAMATASQDEAGEE